MSTSESVNKIINADVLSGLKQLDDESIDLVVTDPPFFVLKGSNQKSSEKADWDQFDSVEDFLSFTTKWLSECYRVLKPDSQAYVFWSQMWQKEFWNLEQPFEIKRMLVWNNPCKTKGFTSKAYLWNYYPVFFLTKGKIKKWHAQFVKKQNVDCFYYPAPQSNWKGENKKTHFLQKPLELVEIFINNSSDEGDLVFDPFIGSGTTAVASVRQNRHFLGFEINPEYVQVAYKRIEPYLCQKKIEEAIHER